METKNIKRYIPLAAGVTVGLLGGLALRKGPKWIIGLTLLGGAIGGGITFYMLNKDKKTNKAPEKTPETAKDDVSKKTFIDNANKNLRDFSEFKLKSNLNPEQRVANKIGGETTLFKKSEPLDFGKSSLLKPSTLQPFSINPKFQ